MKLVRWAVLILFLWTGLELSMAAGLFALERLAGIRPKSLSVRSIPDRHRRDLGRILADDLGYLTYSAAWAGQSSPAGAVTSIARMTRASGPIESSRACRRPARSASPRSATPSRTATMCATRKPGRKLCQRRRSNITSRSFSSTQRNSDRKWRAKPA